ncbi:MAG: hypothetical protein Cons2KO_10880 [Congregibacter sp.]
MHPDRAKLVWYDCRQRLADLPVESPPTPYQLNLAGSALEAANLHLQTCEAGPATATTSSMINCYADTAITLIDMLCQHQKSQLAILVMAGASAMLEHLARIDRTTETALFACRRLTHESSRRIRRADLQTPPSAATTYLRVPSTEQSAGASKRS